MPSERILHQDWRDMFRYRLIAIYVDGYDWNGSHISSTYTDRLWSHLMLQTISGTEAYTIMWRKCVCVQM